MNSTVFLSSVQKVNKPQRFLWHSLSPTHLIALQLTIQLLVISAGSVLSSSCGNLLELEESENSYFVISPNYRHDDSFKIERKRNVRMSKY